MSEQAEKSVGIGTVRLIGLFLGPLLAVVLYRLLPTQPADSVVVIGLTHAGKMTLAIGAWLAAWWVTEAIPLEAAALLPLVAFPIAGVCDMERAASPYADEVVFLFLGGMIIGTAMERWGLHRRVALFSMLLIGTRPAALIAGLLCTTAVLSMWVSNTAAAIMMLPIAMGIVALTRPAESEPVVDEGSPQEHASQHFATAAILAVAYGASIGGVGTLVGTPPNGVMASFVAKTYQQPLTFGDWLKIGLPTMLMVLPLAWVLLLVMFPFRHLRVAGARDMLVEQSKKLGRVSRGEWAVIVVFVFVSVCWILRVQIAEMLGIVGVDKGGRQIVLLTDAGIAIMGAMLLFIIPVRPARGEFAMDWRHASKLPWGILLLFGGGLSLSAAIKANSVDAYVATLMNGLVGMPSWLVVLCVALAAIFISEIGSNTAVCLVLLPIGASMATAVGVSPYELCFAIALGSSLAFMLPSGTPPNALAYSTGHLRIGQMIRGGLALNFVCAIIITLVVHFLGPAIGGIPK